MSGSYESWLEHVAADVASRPCKHCGSLHDDPADCRWIMLRGELFDLKASLGELRRTITKAVATSGDAGLDLVVRAVGEAATCEVRIAKALERWR